MLILAGSENLVQVIVIYNLVHRASPLPFPYLAPGEGKRRGPGNEVVFKDFLNGIDLYHAAAILDLKRGWPGNNMHAMPSFEFILS